LAETAGQEQTGKRKKQGPVLRPVFPWV